MSTITVQSLNGFSGLVGLSCENAPAGVTCSFNPNPVVPSPGVARTSELTINVAADALAGTFVLDIKGNSGVTTHSFALQLTVTQRVR
jgi:uncharacterized membrane protein